MRSEDSVNFVEIASGLTQFYYVATGLNAGTTYHFIVHSRNAYEYSNDSEVLSLLCATLPIKPEAPTTTTISNFVRVSWPTPVNNGSPITGYQVFIQQKDGVYTQEFTDCLGYSAEVIAQDYCDILLDTLTAAPYSLVLNDEVWAQVRTQNFYGWSLISDAGNSGLIKLVPDAPINLVNEPDTTAAEQIKLSWQ
jgi:hypothetical protein